MLNNYLADGQDGEIQHADSLALLHEVADYLNRLPNVPATRALLQRVENHLRAPGLALVQRRQAATGLQLKGGAYNAKGLPLIEAHVNVPTTLTIRSSVTTVTADQVRHVSELLKLLSGDGVEIPLSPCDQA